MFMSIVMDQEVVTIKVTLINSEDVNKPNFSDKPVSVDVA